MTDPILLWNAVALEANRVSHTNGQNEQTGPTLSSRALAIVHLAMYDAYAGVVKDAKDYPRYDEQGPTTPLGPDAIDAAVADGIHDTRRSVQEAGRVLRRDPRCHRRKGHGGLQIRRESRRSDSDGSRR